MAHKLRRAAIVAALSAWLVAPAIDAHKAVTSKFTYNEDVFPIVRDRCGRCHIEGGPTPMSLMTYKDAVPWAESIREQLIAQAMPPWFADPLGPAVKDGHQLTARELDILLTWAVGGTPEGKSAHVPGDVGRAAPWKAGPPDMILQLPTAHTVPAGKIEDVRTFTIATAFGADRWIRAADIEPGRRSMVRAATVAVEKGPVLVDWVPGHDPTPSPAGAAFHLPAGATLRATVHYRKHWLDETTDVSDRSEIGLYFADAPVSPRPIARAEIGAGSDVGGAAAPTFSTMLKSAARVLAFSPTLDQRYATITADAVLPSGKRVPLIRLQAAQPRWTRRYWLVEPIELPGQTKIEVTAIPAPAGRLSPAVVPDGPLRFAIDYVPAG